MSHIAEDITESPTFSGDKNLLLLFLIFFAFMSFSPPALLLKTLLLLMILVIDGVPKEGLRIQDVLVRIAVLLLVRDKVSIVI